MRKRVPGVNIRHLIYQVNSSSSCVTPVACWHNNLSYPCLAPCPNWEMWVPALALSLINREVLDKPPPPWVNGLARRSLRAESTLKTWGCFSCVVCPSECLFSLILPISSPEVRRLGQSLTQTSWEKGATRIRSLLTQRATIGQASPACSTDGHSLREQLGLQCGRLSSQHPILKCL